MKIVQVYINFFGYEYKFEDEILSKGETGGNVSPLKEYYLKDITFLSKDRNRFKRNKHN